MSTKSTPKDQQERARKLNADRQRRFKAKHQTELKVQKEAEKDNRIRFTLDKPIAEMFLAMCQIMKRKPGALIDWLVGRRTENGCFHMPLPRVETESHPKKIPVDILVDYQTKGFLKRISMSGNPQFLGWSLGEIVENLILYYWTLKEDGTFILNTGTADAPVNDTLMVLHGATKGQKHKIRVQRREEVREAWKAKEDDKRNRKQAFIDKAVAKRDARLERELNEVVSDARTEVIYDG